MSQCAGTLHMFCGKIASGKSTLAAALSNSPNTILLSEDELLSRLYPGEINSLEDYARSARRLRSALATHVEELLRKGLNIILDFQANTPEFRKWGRDVAQAACADHKLHFLLADDELCKRRLAVRNSSGEHQYQVSEREFEHFANHFVPPLADEGWEIITHRQF